MLEQYLCWPHVKADPLESVIEEHVVQARSRPSLLVIFEVVLLQDLADPQGADPHPPPLSEKSFERRNY